MLTLVNKWKESEAAAASSKQAISKKPAEATAEDDSEESRDRNKTYNFMKLLKQGDVPDYLARQFDKAAQAVTHKSWFSHVPFTYPSIIFANFISCCM